MDLASDQVLGDIVDVSRYPLSDPGSQGWQDVVSQARRDLDRDGCTVLPGFIRSSMVDTLRQECAGLAPQAYYAPETVNVYNTAVDSPLPEDHPGRITMERGNAFVARDQIPPHFLIHQLYAAEPFQRLVADCFDLPRVHELADPLAGLVLNVLTPGKSHPWHFDLNEFTVSLLTQAPTDGGVFDYCPNIRTPRQENFADVRAVLTGHGEHLIRRLSLRPGDIQLFRGRFALHQVSAVQGDTARHTAIFAYTGQPGVVGGAARTMQLFGRVLPVHQAGDAVRGDRLLD